jgi:hypothetical protein
LANTPQRLTKRDEQEFLEAMRTIKDRLDLQLSAIEANCLFANLQLALRHPANIGPSSVLTRRIASHLYEWLTYQAPALKGGLEAGWNEAHDYVVKGDDETRIVISVPRAQRAVTQGVAAFIDANHDLRGQLAGDLLVVKKLCERLSESLIEALLTEATKGTHAAK